MKKIPSKEYLDECFDYNCETGVLTWRERPLSHFGTEKEWLRFNNTKPGREAGGVQRYKRLQLGGQTYKAHRLIWRMMTGEDPSDMQINHIDGNTENNAWVNLELVTAKQNIRHAYETGLAKGRGGTSHHNCKLSELEVSHIIKLRKDGVSAVEISSMYNISVSHVYHIAKGYTWKHLGGSND